MYRRSLYVAIALMLILIIGFKVCNNKNARITHDKSDVIYVSIPPLKYLVDYISGKSLIVKVLVPYGASPETFEPTPRQLKDLTNCLSIFTVGLLDFEKMLITNNSGVIVTPIINLSEDLPLLQGNEHIHHHGHTHSHHGGADPHIWSSPRRLKRMAETIYEKLSKLYPDDNEIFSENLIRLLHELDVLDSEIAGKIDQSNVKYILIYHPALAYYAYDYNIVQVSMEEGGKEPSADHFRNIIDLAKSNGIDIILYQKEFSTSVVQTIARDIGAEMVEIDPLDEDVVGNLRRITSILTGL